jgi:hypothetical protein
MKTNEHPLFPPLDDDEDPPEVEYIHVSRFENGRNPWCSHKFAPEELQDLEEISDLFGGGMYELIAKNGPRISAKRRYEIAGRSKPLVFGAVGVETEPERTIGPAPVAQPGMGDTGMLGVVMQMMNQNAQSSQATMQMMMKSSSDNLVAMTGMMTAMLSRDGAGNSTLIQAIQSNADRALQSQAQVFQTMLQSVAGGGAGVVGALKDGIALGKEMGGTSGGGGEDNEDTLGETIGNVMEGLKFAAKITGDGPPEAEEVENVA